MFRSNIFALLAVACSAYATPAGARTIDASSAHACAVVDGGVRCWGDNSTFALGSPGFSESALAIDVIGLEPGAGQSVTSVSTGPNSSCAVVQNGLMCWGSNFSGQLGDGSTVTRELPTPVLGFEPGTESIEVTDVAVGRVHSCAVDRGGVRCWGANSQGQLGDGSLNDSLSPVAVLGLEPGTGRGVVAVAVGAQHSCAAGIFGLKCWGGNKHAVFGANHRSQTPVTIPDFPGPISVLDAADATTCAVSGNTLKCWGNAPLGDGTENGNDSVASVPFLPAPVTDVSIGQTGSTIGERHSCAVASGIAYCWGDGRYGQIGDGNHDRRLLPEPVQGFDTPSGQALQVSAGENHTCGLHSELGIRCWGSLGFGSVGDGRTAQMDTPDAVAPPANTAATALSASFAHTCALIASRMWCWGDNRHGQLGNGNQVAQGAPVQVINLGIVTSISTGASHSCGVQSGQVWCWGSNEQGQLGRDPILLQRSASPLLVSGLPAIAHVIGGNAAHTCAISTGGALYCWGDNSFGQTGAANPDGTPDLDETWKPHLVFASGTFGASAGFSHTCAVISGGVSCWGSDFAGELGNGPGTSGPTPGQVFGLGPDSGATQVSVGSYYSCAVANGGVLCWGVDFGSIDTGSVTFSETPQPVGLPAGSGVSTVSTSTATTCAIVSGSPKCWGLGRYGALGMGNTESIALPTAVPGISQATAIATTGFHTCALSSGGATCWGWAMDGRLGTQATWTQPLPASVVSERLFRSGFE